MAVLIEAPDMQTIQAALATPEARVAEDRDGVHVETIQLFVDASGARTMSTNDYEQAIAEFRRVLTAVSPDQIDHTTPCASFSVAQLIDHTIGTQRMVVGALRGESSGMARTEEASGDLVVTYEGAAAEAVVELQRDGALDRVVTLPFGSFSGEGLMFVAVGHMAHAPRGDEPAPYGPEQAAPSGATAADRLAAFLGRVV